MKYELFGIIRLYNFAVPISDVTQITEILILILPGDKYKVTHGFCLFRKVRTSFFSLSLFR